MFSSKRGWFAQAIIGIVILFAIGIVYALTFMAQKTINDEIQLDDTLSNESKVTMQNTTNAYPSTFDSAFGLLAIIIWIIVLALAYKGASNPLFVVVAILVISALGFVGMILGNAWSEIDADNDLNVYTSEFPITSFLLGNFLTYVLILLFSGVMVYMYANSGLG